MTRRSRAVLRAGVIAGGLAVGCVAVVLLLGGDLAEPVRRPAGDPPRDLDVRAVEIESRSGGIVRGWVHTPVDPRGAVLLLHGVRSSRHAMIGRARFLAASGHAVLLVDLHAHGESDGDRITFGHLESRDVAASVRFLRDELPGVPRAVIGTSLGGAAALLAPQPIDVDALVLEAVYPDVRNAIENRLRLRFGAVGAVLTPLLTAQLRPRLGVGPGELRPIDRIGLVNAPVLLIAGEQDRRTTLEESLALFDAAREPKELWTIPGAAHVDFHRFDRTAYEHRVRRFLEASFSRHAGPAERTLVERPAGDGRGTNWRSGRQRLYGPYTASEIPSELVVDGSGVR